VEIIAHVFICSLFIFGVWNAFNPGFVFEKIDAYLDSRLPQFLYKPLLGCVICMPSLYGTAYYLIFIDQDFGFLVFFPAVSGLNLFLSRLLP
jgi:hypothetical protein